MPDLKIVQEESGIQRTRKRRESLKIDKDEIVNRVIDFYNQEISNRSNAVEKQIQLYAKYRMWSEGKDYPWEDATDAALPDLMTHSQRIQDTLYNAVLTMRPAISSSALSGKDDQEKQDTIDRLIDFQVFIENDGETFLGDATESFVNDPALIVYTPWVREDRDVSEILIYDEIPPDQVPVVYFKQLLTEKFPRGNLYKKSNGWDWEVEDDDKTSKVGFYTREDDKVEMLLLHNKRIFDAPRPTVLEWEDVIYPVRSANLQPPGPANPKGASKVVIRSYPEMDEIKRHIESGFYDLVSDDDAKNMGLAPSSINDSDQEREEQKDRMEGKTAQPQTSVPSHKPLTRLMCFDRYDVDGDGLDEDVIWWVILETKTLLRAKYLTEMFPSDPPRRPLAHNSFIGVKGRVDGISLLELLESTHDLQKQFADQVGDGGTIANTPFGFYDPTSGMKQEVIRISPGDLYPLADPTRSVYFPNMPGQAQAFGINMLSLFGSQQDKLAMQSDLQFGRVPAGQASALRTKGGQQLLLGQGEARPERILRRFFTVLTEVWAQIHELNQRFLPEDKKFKVIGYTEPEKDPYLEIKDRSEISGRFKFDFKANVLNSSKQALQGVLMQLLPLYFNPLNFQLGLVTPDKAYRFQAKLWKAFGQDPKEDFEVPPDADEPKILAEEAITSMLNNELPRGIPMEPSMEHFQKLVAFSQSDEFGFLDNVGTHMFQEYLMKVRERVVMEQQQMQMAQMASQMTGQQNQGQQAAPPDMSTPPVQGNELLDETLPSARGAA